MNIKEVCLYIKSVFWIQSNIWDGFFNGFQLLTIFSKRDRERDRERDRDRDRDRERDRERQRERQTERQRDRQRERQRETERDRERDMVIYEVIQRCIVCLNSILYKKNFKYQ